QGHSLTRWHLFPPAFHLRQSFSEPSFIPCGKGQTSTCRIAVRAQPAVVGASVIPDMPPLGAGYNEPGSQSTAVMTDGDGSVYQRRIPIELIQFVVPAMFRLIRFKFLWRVEPGGRKVPRT